MVSTYLPCQGRVCPGYWSETLLDCGSFLTISSVSNDHDFYCQTAASNSLWPEFEITCEDEGEFDEPISSDNGSGNALVSRSRTEGSDGNLMNYFEVIFSHLCNLLFLALILK